VRRSILALVALQFIIAVAIAAGLIEREAAFFVTAFLVLAAVFLEFSDAVALFIASLPLYFALPASDTFDTMANWRLLAALLFLRWLFMELSREPSWGSAVITMFKRFVRSPLFLAAAAFLLWGLARALAAPYPGAGIKKVLFLLNIFLVFPVVRTAAEKEGRKNIIAAVYVALGIVLGAGFLQLGAIFLFTLEQFWRFWAGHVIPIFYGYGLGELLQTSNTWFSFGGDGPPILRMFSVFPDSHSFAMFLMFASVIVTGSLLRKVSGRNIAWLVLIFLALIFSGSRGVWLSAAVLGALLCLGYVLARKLPLYAGFAPLLKKVVISFLIFGILFVPASLVSSLSQRAQGAKADAFASLKRAKSIADLDEVSNRSRLQIWHAALTTIGRYPVLGVGFGNFSVALGERIEAARRGASAHNLYLDIASESGIPGLMCFLAIIGIILWRAWRALARSGPYVADNAVFIIYTVWVMGYSFFDVVLLNDKVLLLAVALAALMYENVPIPFQQQRSGNGPIAISG